MSFTSEFKDFIMRGNVMDMAVGIIIGGAFNKIVSSAVNDVIMPPIGLAIGGTDFTKLTYTLSQKTLEDGTIEAITVNYGLFLQTLLDFVILALVIFMLIKTVNNLQKSAQKKQEEAPPPAPPKQEVLLEEIRDLLKTNN